MSRWVDGEHHARVRFVLEATEDLRRVLSNHPLYDAVVDLPTARIFMKSHAFAVWDFMSLLKELQRRLTGVRVPWVPCGDAIVRRFINELVLEEESDEHPHGGFTSHFELYADAMLQAGCRTEVLDEFVSRVGRGEDVSEVLNATQPSACVQQFVRSNFRVIREGADHEIAATFAFGREELIPRMFEPLLLAADARPDELSLFAAYLRRHIVLDGEHHTPMAFHMLSVLCRDDETAWAEAAQAATTALRARVALWDGVHDEIASAFTPAAG